MGFLESTNRRLILYHVLYWLLFVAFFTLVWGTYDEDYYRNFMVQVLSLPSRLVLVYVTLSILFPIFLKKNDLAMFIVSYMLLLLFCTVVIQRGMMLFVIEGRFLPYHSENYFNLLQLTNTMLDVNLAAIVPVGSKLLGYWMQSRKKLDELQVLNQKLKKPNNQFVLFKKGANKHKVFLHNILYVESQKNYIKVITKQNEQVFYESISKLEQTLKGHQFLRVHRSYIINLAFLESFSSSHLVLSGRKIPIGRKYKDQVVKVLGK